MSRIGDVYRRNRAELERLQLLAQRSGPPRGVIDEKFAEMASEILQAKVADYVAAFRRENLIPTKDEVHEICAELRQDAHGIWFRADHQPMPSSADMYMQLVPRAELKLNIAVGEMHIEQRYAASQGRRPHSSTDAEAEDLPASSSSELTVDDVDALELKPNIFGIGVNLNHIIKRMTKWRVRRRQDKKR